MDEGTIKGLVRSLKILEISEKDLKNTPLGADDLFYLKIESANEILGPIPKQHILDTLSKYPELYSLCFVKALSQIKWGPLYNHPLFQRRRPEVLKVEEEEKDQTLPKKDLFLVLKQGIKEGPYSEEEIKTKLKEKEILFTDLISIEGSDQWEKIFLHDRFDRRLLENRASQQLPENIQEETLVINRIKVEEELENNQNPHSKIYLLADFAKSTKSDTEETQSKKKRLDSWKIILKGKYAPLRVGIGLSLLLAVGIFTTPLKYKLQQHPAVAALLGRKKNLSPNNSPTNNDLSSSSRLPASEKSIPSSSTPTVPPQSPSQQAPTQIKKRGFKNTEGGGAFEMKEETGLPSMPSSPTKQDLPSPKKGKIDPEKEKFLNDSSLPGHGPASEDPSPPENFDYNHSGGVDPAYAPSFPVEQEGSKEENQNNPSFSYEPSVDE